jgi:glucose-1-phosphatase
MTIEAVVFDLGGVLIDVQYARAIARLRARCSADADMLQQALRSAASLQRFECGELTPREFHTAFCDVGRLDIGFEEFCAVYCDIFEPMPQMIEAHQQLRASGMATYIFSNTSELHLTHIRRHYSFVSQFDGYFLSYELGVMKPDDRAYAAVETALGRPVSALLYIDDRVENVEAGARRGWHALHHTDAPATIARLRSFGLYD